MSKILVTGGAGFIGSNLVNQLSSDNDITIIDDLSMGNIDNIKKNKNVKFYKKSVLDKVFIKEIITKENYDYIYHFAAIASVADSIERPYETHKVNFSSVLFMLETLKKLENRKLKRLIFPSSAAVYGDEVTLPKSEESMIKPLSPYAIDKFSAEKYVLMYNSLYGVPTSAVRFFNVYGPYQNPNSPYSGVLSIMVDCFKKSLENEKNEFILYGNGEQSRDFVYINDVIEALILISHSKSALGQVYNIGTGVESTLNHLIEVLSSHLSIDLYIKKKKTRDGDIHKSVADIQKLKDLGFQAKFSINRGIYEYLTFLKLINE